MSSGNSFDPTDIAIKEAQAQQFRAKQKLEELKRKKKQQSRILNMSASSSSSSRRSVVKSPPKHNPGLQDRDKEPAKKKQKLQEKVGKHFEAVGAAASSKLKKKADKQLEALMAIQLFEQKLVELEAIRAETMIIVQKAGAESLLETLDPDLRFALTKEKRDLPAPPKEKKGKTRRQQLKNAIRLLKKKMKKEPEKLIKERKEKLEELVSALQEEDEHKDEDEDMLNEEQ